MTGYGRAESVLEGKKLIIEVKSLNHRNLEMSMRMPNHLNLLELEIRKKISEKISRGRLDITLRLNSDGNGESSGHLDINFPLVQNYYTLFRQIKANLGLQDDVTLGMLAGLKDVITVSETELDIDAAWKTIKVVLDEALNTLIIMRAREGDLLHQDFLMRLRMVDDYLENLALRAPQVVVDYRNRLSERVRELTNGLSFDEARLAQEVAFMAEKSDITEEIVRFKSHLQQLRELLQTEEAVGRKMDFILQEMHREVNTIGAKSNDVEIARGVIEIKTELAKMREQVQNVE